MTSPGHNPRARARRRATRKAAAIVWLAFIVPLFLPSAAAPQTGAMADAAPAGRSLGEVRWLLDFQIGTASGLGYKLPSLALGLAVEQPIGTLRGSGQAPWEVQGEIKWSPDRKYITGNGNTLILDGKGIFWPIHRLGLTGGVTYSMLWTSQFDKHSAAPYAGFVVRDNWQGIPGRLYLDYFFPTGCQWATPANPCTLQSNREHGIEFYQDVRFYRHWRVAMRGGWVRFADQGNQNQPMPRVWHDTGIFSMVLRYEFRAADPDEAY